MIFGNLIAIMRSSVRRAKQKRLDAKVRGAQRQGLPLKEARAKVKSEEGTLKVKRNPLASALNNTVTFIETLPFALILGKIIFILVTFMIVVSILVSALTTYSTSFVQSAVTSVSGVLDADLSDIVETLGFSLLDVRQNDGTTKRFIRRTRRESIIDPGTGGAVNPGVSGGGGSGGTYYEDMAVEDFWCNLSESQMEEYLVSKAKGADGSHTNSSILTLNLLKIVRMAYRICYLEDDTGERVFPYVEPAGVLGTWLLEQGYSWIYEDVADRRLNIDDELFAYLTTNTGNQYSAHLVGAFHMDSKAACYDDLNRSIDAFATFLELYKTDYDGIHSMAYTHKTNAGTTVSDIRDGYFGYTGATVPSSRNEARVYLMPAMFSLVSKYQSQAVGSIQNRYFTNTYLVHSPIYIDTFSAFSGDDAYTEGNLAKLFLAKQKGLTSTSGLSDAEVLQYRSKLTNAFFYFQHHLPNFATTGGCYPDANIYSYGGQSANTTTVFDYREGMGANDITIKKYYGVRYNDSSQNYSGDNKGTMVSDLYVAQAILVAEALRLGGGSLEGFTIAPMTSYLADRLVDGSSINLTGHMGAYSNPVYKHAVTGYWWDGGISEESYHGLTELLSRISPSAEYSDYGADYSGKYLTLVGSSTGLKRSGNETSLWAYIQDNWAGGVDFKKAMMPLSIAANSTTTSYLNFHVHQFSGTVCYIYGADIIDMLLQGILVNLNITASSGAGSATDGELTAGIDTGKFTAKYPFLEDMYMVHTKTLFATVKEVDGVLSFDTSNTQYGIAPMLDADKDTIGFQYATTSSLTSATATSGGNLNISSPWGYYYDAKDKNRHRAIDIAGSGGDENNRIPIVAIADGIMIINHKDGTLLNGGGYTAIVEHYLIDSGKARQFQYMHLHSSFKDTEELVYTKSTGESSYPVPFPNDGLRIKVSKGDLLGFMGGTSASGRTVDEGGYAIHLHLGIQNSTANIASEGEGDINTLNSADEDYSDKDNLGSFLFGLGKRHDLYRSYAGTTHLTTGTTSSISFYGGKKVAPFTRDWFAHVGSTVNNRGELGTAENVVSSVGGITTWSFDVMFERGKPMDGFWGQSNYATLDTYTLSGEPATRLS